MRKGYIPIQYFLCIEEVRALQKLSYPSCIGQTAATWIVSPFGFHVLLSLLRGERKRDINVKVYNELKSKQQLCKIKLALFCAKDFKDTQEFKAPILSDDLIREEADFTKKSGAQTISQWVIKQAKEFEQFNIEKNIPTDTKFTLVNLCNFQCPWQTTETIHGRFMKVHNSFNYTQDVNYEARIMELPMDNEDWRLIVVAPNKVDPLNTLFRRLTNEGVLSTFTTMRPLFTVDSVFVPPSIAIASRIDISLVGTDRRKNPNEQITQYGKIRINDKGVSVDVLTCLCTTTSTSSGSGKHIKTLEKAPYFFAVTFKDTPIFTGQYVPSVV